MVEPLNNFNISYNDMERNMIIIFSIAFIFIMTSIGGLTIFIKRETGSKLSSNLFLGFAGGVMLAASFFSLLIPSFSYSNMINISEIIPAAGGVIIGALFILIFDIIISKNNKEDDYRDKKLFFAMTLHNIPEGLAVGLTFGLALSNYEDVSIISGAIFAIGIGIQNFPEGAALALPLSQSFKSKKKAFLYTIISGIVEPIFAIIGIVLATKVLYLMPWALCFGAGAMIYVIIDELIVNTEQVKEKRLINISFIVGFLIMMALDLSF